ncbi:MAG: aminopeptidase N, partial [Pseudomonadota bacterium]
ASKTAHPTCRDPTVPYWQTDEQLILSDVPDTFVLETDVTIDPSANTVLSGLYMSGGRFCSQCESTGFRRITYWPDRPDVMSRFFVRIEAEQAAYPILLSNGTPGAAGTLNDGRHFAEWDDPHLKPSYLFALCAGDYDVYRDHFTTMNGDAVDLAVHVDKGQADRAAWAMESLKASMKWDEDVFKRAYDLGVFNIVAVRDFNFGAMENKGLNVFNSAYVLASEDTATDADFEAIESIVAHEYFHNWTGNRITCRDWFQLCLKEGLTVYRDQRFSADMRSAAVQRIKDVIRLRAAQFPEDGGPLAHAVRPDHYASIDNLYTATVYEKGAELIRMLSAYIGEDAFADGMQIYFDRHDGDATTIENFYSCFESASGQNLGAFRRWYSQPGTPTLHVEESWDPASQMLTVEIEQSNPTTPGNDAPAALPMPIRIAAFNPNGDKIDDAVIMLEGQSASWSVKSASDKPLLSVNRGFSAPVRLEQSQNTDERLALARIDDDAFNQWETLQTLARDALLAMTYGDVTEPDAALVQAFADAVRQKQDDPALAALLLRLPAVGELLHEHKPANPVALDASRRRLLVALLNALDADSAALLDTPSPSPFSPMADQAGIRALRSAYLGLLGVRATETDRQRLVSIYDAATNMTERLAALRALCEVGGDDKRLAVSKFYDAWSENELVIDKWFAVQAGTGDHTDIETLLRHPDFDLSNPNRVRSVVAVFAMQNLPAFHAPDGSGHKLVAGIIGECDKRNPALAARLLQTYDQWRLLEPNASNSAKQVLKDLLDGDLSSNAADIVSRALA